MAGVPIGRRCAGRTPADRPTPRRRPRLQPLDLGIDADDVRVPFARQLEGRDRAGILAHFGADHAEAGIGAEVARLALHRLADVGERGREVAASASERSARLFHASDRSGAISISLVKVSTALLQFLLLHLGDAAHHQLRAAPDRAPSSIAPRSPAPATGWRRDRWRSCSLANRVSSTVRLPASAP